MRIRRKFISYIYISILLFLGIFFLFLFTDPREKIISSLPFTFTHLFLLLFFLCVGAFFTFFVKKIRVGILIGIFFTGIVVLKLLDLSRIPYILLLFVVLVGAEFYFRSKKNSKS